MKILFTFEYPDLMCRCEDYMNLLLNFGHEVFLYGFNDKENYWANFMEERMKGKENFHVLHSIPKFNDYRAWYYELSSIRWQYPSIVANDLVDYKGDFLACINYEDGYGFLEDRITWTAQDKTCLFMNNALWKNRDKYPKSLHKKMFLTTSYIENSQKFKNYKRPLEKRARRVIFSGSLTGNSTILTNYSKEEEKLRATLALKVWNDKNINSIIRFINYEPTFKHYYDNDIPSELKQNASTQKQFLLDMLESYISLAIKGNSYPTNRFFESQAAGCLTFSTKVDAEVDVYGIGNRGENYVEIDAYGNDLIDKIKYYFSHENEAKKIAEKGREIWEKYNMLDDNGIFLPETMEYHIKEIKRITGFDLKTT